jgi:hypothetical protein
MAVLFSSFESKKLVLFVSFFRSISTSRLASPSSDTCALFQLEVLFSSKFHTVQLQIRSTISALPAELFQTFDFLSPAIATAEILKITRFSFPVLVRTKLVCRCK